MSRPAVSVVMPSYNAAETIRASIQSVIDQTFADWELLVVDDCSRDATLALVSEIAQHDSRVVVLTSPSNGGPAAARNLGLSRAHGRYLAFLDSDDIWHPEKLERQLAAMAASDASASCTGYRLKQDGEETSQAVIPPAVVTYERMLRGSVVGCLTVVLDTEKLGRPAFDEGKWIRQTIYGHWLDNLGHEDFILWLRILREETARGRPSSFIGLTDQLATYRVHGASFSGNKKKAALFQWIIYRHIERLPMWLSITCFTRYAMQGVFKHRALRKATS